MEIKISAQKFELTAALKEYITKKIEKIKRYSQRFNLVEVHIEVEKHRYMVRVLLKGTGEPIFGTTEDKDSMYKAIDLCLHKIEKQLTRAKTLRVKQQHRR